CRRQGEVSIDERVQWLDELGAIRAQPLHRKALAVQHVMLYEPREPILEIRRSRSHDADDFASVSVRAVIARAYCMRQASSDLPSVCATSGNESSSKARSRITWRLLSVSGSGAVSSRSARSSRMSRDSADRLRAASRPASPPRSS